MAGTVNCYPHCTEQEIVTKMLELNPCIDIKVYTVTPPLDGRGVSAFDEIIDKAENIKKLQTKTETGNYQVGADDSGDKDHYQFLHGLYGFISLLTADVFAEYENIPIFSSPQIQTKNGAGWKDEQSLFGFLQTMVTGDQGILGGFLKETGVNNIVNGAMNVAEAIGGLAGWSPRVGPYFSFKDNPFSNKPSLNVKIKLINDSLDSVKMNHKFLNIVVRDSLIGSKDGTGFLFKWKPPRLFSVTLKWGASGTPVKVYRLCNLDATITPEGIMRKNVPDAYDVNLTFTSILPDTKDIWRVGGAGFVDDMPGVPRTTNY